MSERVGNLSKEYKRKVLQEEQPRSIGLFPIPEYPELEADRGMWSEALDIILTTLRYLAPATLLTLFWSQQSFLFKILKHIDSALRAIIFSSEEQKKEVLQWLAETGPVTVENLDTVWRHGWILCAVLDAKLPGACAGHSPTRLSLKHAQAIAEHYLAVEPIFSRQELESNDSLSRHQEWKLATYLDRIRQALNKLTPPVSKQSSLRTSPETTQFTGDYVAGGTGLSAAQINNKMNFKIYPTAQQSVDPGEITILIRGPKEICGMIVIPPILGKAQLIRQRLLGLQSRTSYTENKLPLTQGATYLRNYGRNKMDKTYFIPKSKYAIKIDIENRSEYTRVSYTVPLEGKYEISITSKGMNIVGSPYTVKACKDIISILERQNSNCEHGEEIDIVDMETNKKVVLRIVDFVTEKMLLKENGTLERISNDEAMTLMTSQKNNLLQTKYVNLKDDPSKSNKETKMNKFYTAVNNVIKMIKICKIFKSLIFNNLSEKINITNNAGIDSKIDVNILQDKPNKYIVAPNIYVSIRTEKSKNYEDSMDANTSNSTRNFDMGLDNLQSGCNLRDNESEDDSAFSDIATTSSNPFADDTYDQNYITQKKLGAFVNTEYERNNSQNEETQPVKIAVQNISSSDSNDIFHNVYFDPQIVRPKTPILKIITGEIDSCKTSVYVDPNMGKLLEKNLEYQPFLNPFNEQCESSEHRQPVTDFITGAPVSMLSNSKISHTETNLKPFESVKFHKSGYVTLKDNDKYQVETAITKRDMTTPEKDTWDSAYVSIDENICSPGGNNTNISGDSRQLFPKHGNYELTPEELSEMGPAEREIWRYELDNVYDDIKTATKDYIMFSPIYEERERNSITAPDTCGLLLPKDNIDSVTEALAKLNTVCQEIFPNSEYSSIQTLEENLTKIKDNELQYTTEKNDVRIDSASEILSDVMRYSKKFEGEISEVQATVSESISVSRTLQNENKTGNENAVDIKLDCPSEALVILEKKEIGDEQTEVIIEENKAHYRKKRSSTKNLKYGDSLTKRKGKLLVKNFLKAAEFEQEEKVKRQYPLTPQVSQESGIEVNIVEKWKKYWDTKLEIEKEISNSTSKILKSKPPTNKEHLSRNSSDENVKTTQDSRTCQTPVKQELPEEVYKAFEINPKTFFGTSRNQIMCKIDSFSSTPSTTSTPNVSEVRSVCRDSGLVSSRISLFHSISQHETFSMQSRKCKSMQNIFQRKGSDRTFDTHEKISIYADEEDVKYNKNEESVSLKNKIETMKLKEDIKNKKNNVNDESEVLKEMKISVKEKRNLFMEKFHKAKSFDETPYSRKPLRETHTTKLNKFINRTTENDQVKNRGKHSKSEMDIFSKVTSKSVDTCDNLEKYKSCEDLPKMSVKNVISLYENVSKSSVSSKPTKTMPKKSSPEHSETVSLTSVTDIEPDITQHCASSNNFRISVNVALSDKKTETTVGDRETPDLIIVTKTSKNTCKTTPDDDNSKDTYLSLSDIDFEIVDNADCKIEKKTPERELKDYNTDYKSRFKMAKEYFQSLEELRDVKRPPKINECQILLQNQSHESQNEIEENKSRKRVKTIKKSNSMPSSEIRKVWIQLQEDQENGENKYVKISEKFNVDDLFSDVTEGKLSRQGSFKGIPNKKAVLETFKSMENLFDSKLSPYEIVASQLKEYTSEQKVKTSQNYLSEYPYLPTTDPSKYHSRSDATASGLISMKEMLRKRPRRNSVPSNPSLTLDI